MYLTHRTEIFPTQEQQEMLAKMFGYRRLVFNKALEYLLDKYKNLKDKRKEIKKKEIMDLRKLIFRTEDPYKTLLKEIPNQVLDTALEDLIQALESLWKEGKEIKYRSKKSENTARLYKKNDTNFQPTGHNHIHVVKLKTIKLAEKLRFDGDVKIITFTKEFKRYFASITVDVVTDFSIKKTGRHIGFDWGLKTTLTGVDDRFIVEYNFDNSKLIKLDNRINKMHKNLSSHNSSSKNYLKARTKLEKAYKNRTNYQEDQIKKWASELVRRYDYIVMEDLRMGFMFKNKNLSKKAGEAVYYKIKTMFTRKFNQYGKKLYLVSNTFPSTQMCSNCGKVKQGKKKLKLSNRTYKCSCGFKEDRDVNAAINIYNCQDIKENVI